MGKEPTYSKKGPTALASIIVLTFLLWLNMANMNLNNKPALQNKLNLKTAIGLSVIGGALAAALLWFMLRPAATPSACGSCTITITGTSSTNYTVTSGDYICIASGAVYSGTITRNSSSGTGTVNICNEGTIQNATLSFSKGINVIDNRGTMTGSTLSFNSGTSSNTFTNYTGAQATFSSFEISRGSTAMHNYGTFTTTSGFKLSSGATFYNHTDGIMNVGEVEVNSGSSITNDGNWTSLDIKINENGTFTNAATLVVNGGVDVNKTFVSSGTLTISGSLKINSNASATLSGTATVSNNLEVNKTLIVSGTLTVARDMTVNSNGRVTLSGLIVVNDDLENNGYIDGPAVVSGTFGRINVVDRTVQNSSGKSRYNLDVCDAGAPAAGFDTKSGTVDATVTYCVNSPSLASLPVEWAAFEATAQPEGVVLTWATAHEMNNDHFTVERSTDASTFANVEEVPGVGNSNETQTYQTTDKNPPVGTVYYRIRQTDIDGQSSFSSQVEVSWTAPGFSMKVYPNPVTSTTTLEILSDKEEPGTVRVLDLGGRVIYQTAINLQPGQTSLELNASSWTAGMYIVEVRNASASKPAGTLRLVKQ